MAEGTIIQYRVCDFFLYFAKFTKLADSFTRSREST